MHAVCSACKIVLVEASSASDADLGTAENTAATTLHATEISNSFGEPETGSGGTTFAHAFDHPGVVITASSGDDGYYDYDLLGGSGKVSAPSIPAAYPTVVAVGGTSLYLAQSPTPTRAYETVWNDNGPQDAYEQALQSPLGASGGGCSTLFAAQGWQSNVTGYARAACGGKRLVADMAMVADPLTGFDVYDSYTGCSGCKAGWETIGGTSLAAPLAAAAFALAGGAHGLPYPAVALYSHTASAHYDVTVGGNGLCDGEGAPQCPNPNNLGHGILDCAYDASGVPAPGTGACDATGGFDGPTGVGTPASMTLFALPKLTVSAISRADDRDPRLFRRPVVDHGNRPGSRRNRHVHVELGRRHRELDRLRHKPEPHVRDSRDEDDHRHDPRRLRARRDDEEEDGGRELDPEA